MNANRGRSSAAVPPGESIAGIIDLQPVPTEKVLYTRAPGS